MGSRSPPWFLGVSNADPRISRPAALLMTGSRWWPTGTTASLSTPRMMWSSHKMAQFGSQVGFPFILSFFVSFSLSPLLFLVVGGALATAF